MVKQASEKALFVPVTPTNLFENISHAGFFSFAKAPMMSSAFYLVTPKFPKPVV